MCYIRIRILHWASASVVATVWGVLEVYLGLYRAGNVALFGEYGARIEALLGPT